MAIKRIFGFSDALLSVFAKHETETNPAKARFNFFVEDWILIFND